jgi:hypothetical protein
MKNSPGTDGIPTAYLAIFLALILPGIVLFPVLQQGMTGAAWFLLAVVFTANCAALLGNQYLGKE